MFKSQGKIGFIGKGLVTAAAFVVLLGTNTALAAMSSTNYSVVKDSLNFGGDFSTSTNYRATDTIGDTATGEGLSSTNYELASGFQPFDSAGYISFSVKEGTSSPGSSGTGVALGTLSTGSVTTSDGSSINSIFITAEGNGTGGLVVSVVNDSTGLASVSVPADVVTSASATLSAGTEGYGICVFSITEDAGSPTSFTSASPYNGSCDKSSNHAVGITDTTSRTVMSATGELKSGSSEVLVKTAVSTDTAAHSDYVSNLTFIATVMY
ncbi:MAG: hypothetical protein U9Q03_03010 [Patescibacteria group bacterium]|nr:hypothetical protein [Patescibacteria group bacterium]